MLSLGTKMRNSSKSCLWITLDMKIEEGNIDGEKV